MNRILGSYRRQKSGGQEPFMVAGQAYMLKARSKMPYQA